MTTKRKTGVTSTDHQDRHGSERGRPWVGGPGSRLRAGRAAAQGESSLFKAPLLSPPQSIHPSFAHRVSTPLLWLHILLHLQLHPEPAPRLYSLRRAVVSPDFGDKRATQATARGSFSRGRPPPTSRHGLAGHHPHGHRRRRCALSLPALPFLFFDLGHGHPFSLSLYLSLSLFVFFFSSCYLFSVARVCASSPTSLLSRVKCGTDCRTDFNSCCCDGGRGFNFESFSSVVPLLFFSWFAPHAKSY